jgi:FdhD protein
VDLARQAGLTLIGRAKGRRFLCVAGAERLRFDADPAETVAEGAGRKGARDDD